MRMGHARPGADEAGLEVSSCLSAVAGWHAGRPSPQRAHGRQQLKCCRQVKLKRAFFYVQHLLGIGHLRRTAAIANATAARGVEVTLASGGLRVPDLNLHGVRFVQLPSAAAADLSFKSLVDEHRIPVDDEWKSKRRELLLDAWHAAQSQALVIQLFPFGRRQSRFELAPLLEAAAGRQRRPLIVCSVRDILGGGQGNPERQDEMLEAFQRFFDRVLVHGDESIIPFSRTFRHADAIAEKLAYSGYIVEGDDSSACSRKAAQDDSGEVVVSAGGGAVGSVLLETAIRAREFSALANRTWRVLCGVHTPAAELDRLAAIAARTRAGAVLVEPARADFPRLLANCAVSVSQAGYNTMGETSLAGARSVVVPFSGGGETEQSLRAREFESLGLTTVVTEEDLSAQSLSAAIDRAARRPRPSKERIDLG